MIASKSGIEADFVIFTRDRSLMEDVTTHCCKTLDTFLLSLAKPKAINAPPRIMGKMPTLMDCSRLTKVVIIHALSRV